MTGYVKSLWPPSRGDPVFMQRVNGWLTIFWIAMIPISIATGWINSVAYVASLSLWALVSGHWSAWQAARVEVAQRKEEERRAAEDVAGEIVERVVRRPTWRGRGKAGTSRLPATPTYSSPLTGLPKLSTAEEDRILRAVLVGMLREAEREAGASRASVVSNAAPHPARLALSALLGVDHDSSSLPITGQSSG